MARDADARSTAVGRQSSSPVISVFLITAGYGATVPGTLRNGVDIFPSERYSGTPDLPEVYALLASVSRAAAHQQLDEEVGTQMLTIVFDGLAPRP
jgi:hypothetical protein